MNNLRLMDERRDTRLAPGGSQTMMMVVTTLEDLVQDWDIDEAIGSGTRVVADLGFESVDLIQMVGALERTFRQHRVSLVDMLVKDGRYVDDLTVGQIAEAVSARIKQ